METSESRVYEKVIWTELALQVDGGKDRLSITACMLGQPVISIEKMDFISKHTQKIIDRVSIQT